MGSERLLKRKVLVDSELVWSFRLFDRRLTDLLSRVRVLTLNAEDEWSCYVLEKLHSFPSRNGRKDRVLVTDGKILMTVVNVTLIYCDEKLEQRFLKNPRSYTPVTMNSTLDKLVISCGPTYMKLLIEDNIASMIRLPYAK